MATVRPSPTQLAEFDDGERDRTRLLIEAAHDLLDEGGLEGLTIRARA